MSIEQVVNNKLNKYPMLKRVVKRVYQRIMYAVLPKGTSEGNLMKITPDDQYEYFFGYYDKSPWDASNRYVICTRARNTWESPCPNTKAEIVLIDTYLSIEDTGYIKKLAETSCWNVQQGCMLQWLGPDYKKKIIFNDYRDKKYVSIIFDIESMEEKIVHSPVYSVSFDGTFALTLDFSRLHNLRPGYGYCNLEEATKGERMPNVACIWYVDLLADTKREILNYVDLINLAPREEMKDEQSIHKVNHIMISPDGNRFMFLYRWFIKGKKYTRLITADVNGKDLYLLSDDNMVSHCFWKNNKEILAFANKKESGPGYYLMIDKTNEYHRCWPKIDYDGHPSYSVDGKHVVFDSYPDKRRMQTLFLSRDDTDDVRTIAKVFSPFKYDGDTRCDLHPRWDRNGEKICIDSVFEGKRGMYTVDVTTSLVKNRGLETANDNNR